jgi:hypothetical protein
MKKIGSGDESWLKAAVALRSGSDGAASEMLDSAVGEALEHNAENVFRITLKGFDLTHICSAPDVNEERYNSYKLSLKAIDLRIQKVRSIKVHSFDAITKECIRYLEASKESLAEYYGVRKK